MAVAVALAALAVGGAQAGEGGAEAGEGGLGRRPLFLGNDFIPALTFRNPFAGAELTVAGELSEPQNLFPLLSCSLFGGGGGSFRSAFCVVPLFLQRYSRRFFV